MKTGKLTSMTSGLSVVSLSVLLIVSFSAEVSAKRGCSAFGHSCFGGHGKRSEPDGQNDRFKSVELSREADPANSNSGEDVRDSSNDMMIRALSSKEIQQVQDFIACRNRAIELSRRARAERNYMPILIKEWLTSHRRPYNADLETNDK